MNNNLKDIYRKTKADKASNNPTIPIDYGKMLLNASIKPQQNPIIYAKQIKNKKDVYFFLKPIVFEKICSIISFSF